MKPDHFQSSLVVALLFIVWPASVQPCSINDIQLMNKLTENKEFVEYICPNEREKCGNTSQIAQKIEIRPIRLSPQRPAPHRASEDRFCIVTPARKGKQFPTFIFRSSSASAYLIAEDWDTGLKIIPKVCNGMYNLEGRSITGPGELEIYHLKWEKTNYQEYSRKCYQIREGTGNGLEKLFAVPCQ